MTIDEYIGEASPERRESLVLLQRLCREGLPGFQETMRHGMPSYIRNDVVEVAFASQKSYISLYICRPGALDANARRLGGLSVGNSCVRFRRPEQIDATTVRALLRGTASDSGPVC